MFRPEVSTWRRNSTLTRSQALYWTLAVGLSMTYFMCLADFQVCYTDEMFGFRSGRFCYVFMAFDKEHDELPMTWMEASGKCTRHHGVLSLDQRVIDGYNEFQIARGLPAVSVTQWNEIKQKDGCQDKSTTDDGCLFLCRYPTCAVGWYGHNCSLECHCEFNYLCDTTNGNCHSNCLRGFYGPPQCNRHCHCKNIAECDRITGACPSGCDDNWEGKSCQKKLCVVGNDHHPQCLTKCNCLVESDCRLETKRCSHGCVKGWRGRKCTIPTCQSTSGNCDDRSLSHPCLCSDPECTDPPGKCRNGCKPGWSGSNCMDSACPFGFFGPPACMSRCRCANKRFCSPLDGNCHGTACEGLMTGPSCLSLGCIPGRYGPPDCVGHCYCDKGRPCDPLNGHCKKGCRKGWVGLTCNKRICPEGRYGFPTCHLLCRCLKPKTCNSLTGTCEVGGCIDDWSGRNCTFNLKTSASRYPVHSKPWQAGLSICVFILSGFVTVVIVQYQRCQALTEDNEAVEIEDKYQEDDHKNLQHKTTSMDDLPGSLVALHFEERTGSNTSV